MSQELTTPFSDIYDLFLSQITDDMYMELTEVETEELLEELLLSALPHFEFPRVDLNNFETTFVEDETSYCGVDSDNIEVRALIFNPGHFNIALNLEEKKVISIYMIVEWLGQQLANIDNVRMKFSGADFKLTSQANHMQKLLQLKKSYTEKGFHLQRLYKRRLPDEDGIMRSTFDSIMYPNGGES